VIPIGFVCDDGGRKSAGFKGTARDCVVRAITIAGGYDYADIYAMVNEFGAAERHSKKRKGKSSARTGVHNPTIRRIMDTLGWPWTPTMFIGQGCRVHLRADQLPSGRLVVSLSKHVAAVIDGVLYDEYDCSRDGTRCVYGYWQADGALT